MIFCVHDNENLKKFNEFYLREHRELLGFIKRKSNLYEDAWDILQISFFTIFEKQKKKRNPEYKREILYGTAKNIISKWHRKQNVEEKYHLEFRVAKSPVFRFQTCVLPTPEDILVEKQLQKVFAKALFSLNKNDQEFIGLRLNGVSNKEIAKRLNKKHTNIGVTVNRAISRLKDLFNKGTDGKNV